MAQKKEEAHLQLFAFKTFNKIMSFSRSRHRGKKVKIWNMKNLAAEENWTDQPCLEKVLLYIEIKSAFINGVAFRSDHYDFLFMEESFLWSFVGAWHKRDLKN